MDLSQSLINSQLLNGKTTKIQRHPKFIFDKNNPYRPKIMKEWQESDEEDENETNPPGCQNVRPVYSCFCFPATILGFCLLRLLSVNPCLKTFDNICLFVGIIITENLSLFISQVIKNMKGIRNYLLILSSKNLNVTSVKLY